MNIKLLLLAAAAVAASGISARDIDVEKHVKKYWTIYRNRPIEIGFGDKRWPVTPELRAERQRHFNAMLKKFAPHQVEDASRIDKIFGWKDGTYLSILRYGLKKIEKAPEKRKVCKVGCIGCRKCAKYAPDKFTIEGFLASVNYEAQVLPVREDLDNIKCPTGALLSAEEHHYIEKHNPAWEKSEK